MLYYFVQSISQVSYLAQYSVLSFKLFWSQVKLSLTLIKWRAVKSRYAFFFFLGIIGLFSVMTLYTLISRHYHQSHEVVATESQTNPPIAESPAAEPLQEARSSVCSVCKKTLGAKTRKTPKKSHKVQHPDTVFKPLDPTCQHHDPARELLTRAMIANAKANAKMADVMKRQPELLDPASDTSTQSSSPTSSPMKDGRESSLSTEFQRPCVDYTGGTDLDGLPLSQSRFS